MIALPPVWSRLVTALAVAVTGMAAPLQAQTFYQVSPTGSFYRTSSETPAAPLIISLADYLGATSLHLKPGGKLQVAGGGSPVHDAVFCAVFSTSNDLLASTEQQRVPGALTSSASSDSPCVTGNTLYGGAPTDLTQDFFVPFAGLEVGVPAGANYLFVSVFDDYYSDNVSPNPSAYGITVTPTVISTVPEPSSMLLLGAGLAGLVAVRRSRRAASR